jgi:hypothetical protein
MSCRLTPGLYRDCYGYQNINDFIIHEVLYKIRNYNSILCK